MRCLVVLRHDGRRRAARAQWATVSPAVHTAPRAPRAYSYQSMGRLPTQSGRASAEPGQQRRANGRRLGDVPQKSLSSLTPCLHSPRPRSTSSWSRPAKTGVSWIVHARARVRASLARCWRLRRQPLPLRSPRRPPLLSIALIEPKGRIQPVGHEGALVLGLVAHAADKESVERA